MGIYKMRVMFVPGAGVKTNPDQPTELLQDVWVFVLWGNPRNVAINKAMRNTQWKIYYEEITMKTEDSFWSEFLGFNAVTAWYLEERGFGGWIKEKLVNIKDKINSFNIGF